MELTLVGFIDEGQAESFLSYPVKRPSVLGEWEFDAVLLADIERSREHRDTLMQHHVPNGKVLALSPLV